MACAVGRKPFALMVARLIIAYLLILFDLFMTRQWVALGGLSVDANPLGAWILSAGWRQVAFKIVLPLAVCLLLYRYKRRRAAVIGSWAILAVYAAIAVYHLNILNNIAIRKALNMEWFEMVYKILMWIMQLVESLLH